LASFITDLPYHLPSASVTSLPVLVHHSLHLPAIPTSLPLFRSTFWLAVEDFLTHPRLIHSDHKLRPLHPLPFNIRHSLRH